MGESQGQAHTGRMTAMGFRRSTPKGCLRQPQSFARVGSRAISTAGSQKHVMPYNENNEQLGLALLTS